MDHATKLNRARELQKTIHTFGWKTVIEAAETALKNKETEALMCQDDDQVVRLQRKAQAAREFYEDWINTLVQIQNPEPETKDSDFITVSMEQGSL